MNLRKLELKDAPLMLEWMNDKDNWNVAIVDEEDIYMGTVSLKNIKETSAEFGITIRSCAMGKGYSIWAMKEILRIGFEERGIKKIYWCVSPDNKRAVRFYDKNGFDRVAAKELDMIEGYTQEQIDAYVWYLVEK